jgi:Ca-activated chloride channel family protein
MTFIWPSMLLSLLLLPVLVAVYLRMLRGREAARASLGPLGVVDREYEVRVRTRRHVPPATLLVGLSLLLVGLARPVATVSLPRIEGNVILAFDVSSSMAADDLKPSRLEAAKQAARMFVENQPPGILVGVVAFSGNGLLVQKPTDSREAILDTIDRLSPQGGTSLGEGIFTSLNALSDEPIALDEQALETGASPFHLQNYSSAVVILLTDGENTVNPDPLQVAQLAADAGVRVYPVGIGSPQGVVLELEGFRVLTQLNETVLQQIADTTNGIYYRAEDEESLKDIYQDIDLQMTVRGEKMEVTSVFAGAGLLALLIGGGLSLLWFGRMP